MNLSLLCSFQAWRRLGNRILLFVSVAALAVQCQIASPNLESIDMDFKLQGEYLGTLGMAGDTLGVQVVANGDGRFTAVFLAGGLPGKGWNGTGRIDQKGTRLSDGTVNFPATDTTLEYSAKISSDGFTLSGKTPSQKSFSLSKNLRESPTLNQQPPLGGKVLFNGVDLKSFLDGTASLKDSLLFPIGSAATGATTIQSFGDFTMHVEFLEPFMPANTGQGRGNSGIYLQGRYELQILDSFGLNILRNGDGPATQECGAFYQLLKPTVNMSFPPLSWQTYDIEFSKAKFDVQGKNILDPAMVTVRQNGVIIHDHEKLLSNTLLGDSVKDTDGPIRFQSHGDSVYFRNIWIVSGAGVGIHTPLSKQSGRNKNGFYSDLLSIDGRRIDKSPFNGYYINSDLKGTTPTLMRE